METQAKEIEIGKSIGYGWESVKKDFWYLVGLSLLVTIIGGVFNQIKGYEFLNILTTLWIMPGFLVILFYYYDHNGKKLPIKNLFIQFKYFWRILGASFLIGLITIIGFILLIVPGIYLALTYQFTISLIVDKDLGVFEAMKKSAEMTQGKKLALFGFFWASLGILFLGVLAIGLGVFVAVPIVRLARIYLYKKLV